MDRIASLNYQWTAVARLWVSVFLYFQKISRF